MRRHAATVASDPRVRVRPWAFDRGVVQLALADQAIVPAAERCAAGSTTLAAERSPTVRTIRTGALFPDAAARSPTPGSPSSTPSPCCASTSTDAPRRPRRAAARRRCAPGATATRRGSTAPPSATRGATRPATSPTSAGPRRCTAPAPGSTVAAAVARRQLVAFAITGAAAGQGYLQRLAVAPEHQGHGHGRALVVDSLAWMRARRLAHGLVNTAVGNEPALALYESHGFRPPRRAARRDAARPRRGVSRSADAPPRSAPSAAAVDARPCATGRTAGRPPHDVHADARRSPTRLRRRPGQRWTRDVRREGDLADIVPPTSTAAPTSADDGRRPLPTTDGAGRARHVEARVRSPTALVDERAELAAALDGDRSTRSSRGHRAGHPRRPRRPATARRSRVAVDDPPDVDTDASGALTLRRPGLYPVTVELARRRRAGGRTPHVRRAARPSTPTGARR